MYVEQLSLQRDLVTCMQEIRNNSDQNNVMYHCRVQCIAIAADLRDILGADNLNQHVAEIGKVFEHHEQITERLSSVLYASEKSRQLLSANMQQLELEGMEWMDQNKTLTVKNEDLEIALCKCNRQLKFSHSQTGTQQDCLESTEAKLKETEAELVRVTDQTAHAEAKSKEIQEQCNLLKEQLENCHKEWCMRVLTVNRQVEPLQQELAESQLNRDYLSQCLARLADEMAILQTELDQFREATGLLGTILQQSHWDRKQMMGEERIFKQDHVTSQHDIECARTRPLDTVYGVCFSLDLEYSVAGDLGTPQRAVFEKEIIADLAKASGQVPSMFCIRELSPGSIIVAVQVLPHPSGVSIDPSLVVYSLEQQATDSASLLRAGKLTRRVTQLTVLRTAAPVLEELVMQIKEVLHQRHVSQTQKVSAAFSAKSAEVEQQRVLEEALEVKLAEALARETKLQECMRVKLQECMRINNTTKSAEVEEQIVLKEALEVKLAQALAEIEAREAQLQECMHVNNENCAELDQIRVEMDEMQDTKSQQDELKDRTMTVEKETSHTFKSERDSLALVLQVKESEVNDLTAKLNHALQHLQSNDRQLQSIVACAASEKSDLQDKLDEACDNFRTHQVESETKLGNERTRVTELMSKLSVDAANGEGVCPMYPKEKVSSDLEKLCQQTAEMNAMKREIVDKNKCLSEMESLVTQQFSAAAAQGLVLESLLGLAHKIDNLVCKAQKRGLTVSQAAFEKTSAVIRVTHLEATKSQRAWQTERPDHTLFKALVVIAGRSQDSDDEVTMDLVGAQASDVEMLLEQIMGNRSKLLKKLQVSEVELSDAHAQIQDRDRQLASLLQDLLEAQKLLIETRKSTEGLEMKLHASESMYTGQVRDSQHKHEGELQEIVSWAAQAKSKQVESFASERSILQDEIQQNITTAQKIQYALEESLIAEKTAREDAEASLASNVIAIKRLEGQLAVEIENNAALTARVEDGQAQLVQATKEASTARSATAERKAQVKLLQEDKMQSVATANQSSIEDMESHHHALEKSLTAGKTAREDVTSKVIAIQVLEGQLTAEVAKNAALIAQNEASLQTRTAMQTQFVQATQKVSVARSATAESEAQTKLLQEDKELSVATANKSSIEGMGRHNFVLEESLIAEKKYREDVEASLAAKVIAIQVLEGQLVLEVGKNAALKAQNEFSLQRCAEVRAQLVQATQDASTARSATTESEARMNRLQDDKVLSIATANESSIEDMEKHMKDRHLEKPSASAVHIALSLGLDMASILGQEEAFKLSVTNDVADAVGARRDKVLVVSLDAGSIIVHMGLEQGICDDGRSGEDVALQLATQAADDSSALHQGKYTRMARTVRVEQTSNATTAAHPHDLEVTRLKIRAEKQEARVKEAHAEADVLRQERDALLAGAPADAATPSNPFKAAQTESLEEEMKKMKRQGETLSAELQLLQTALAAAVARVTEVHAQSDALREERDALLADASAFSELLAKVDGLETELAEVQLQLRDALLHITELQLKARDDAADMQRLQFSEGAATFRSKDSEFRLAQAEIQMLACVAEEARLLDEIEDGEHREQELEMRLKMLQGVRDPMHISKQGTGKDTITAA